ncbi:hypothetical protein AVEN_25462-1 [Araneus ventricosus]|uniref:DDE-1 domain-containing protein n=1 Tax=Araneus ventricosus TaxID=182803 RepID=A0A4Y2N7T7_ARAVE|nr:hypothetical protein AVEN_25462-1 [Araneus ventricosus]
MESINLLQQPLFLLDNCPGHPSAEELCTNDGEHFRNVSTPNTTALIQPMDQNVKKNIKLGYRKLLLTNILNDPAHNENLGKTLRIKNKDLKTWRVPPSHDWYKRSNPGGSIGLACDRADQTALSRFVSSHLRSCSFSHGNKDFPVCTRCGVASESPVHILSCLRLSRETLETDPFLALDFLRVSGLMDGV